MQLILFGIIFEFTGQFSRKVALLKLKFEEDQQKKAAMQDLEQQKVEIMSVHVVLLHS